MTTTLNGQVDLVSAIEGTALPGSTDVASFTDSNLSDTPAAFTATIDWGDNVTTTGTVVGGSGNFTVEGGHTYADDDFVTPVVTITRPADGSSLTLSGGVNVSDADNLSGHNAANISGNPNVALTNVTVATFTDSYTGHTDASDFSVNIDWGDGTVTPGTATGSGGSFSVTGSHTYTSAGNFTITTFFNDDSPDASFASATTTADIGFGGTEVFSDAAETVAVPAGTTVATFADNAAGAQASNYTATIDWGDGTITAGVVSGSGPSFTVTSGSAHTYADEGLFTETVTITRTTDNTTIAPSGTVTVAERDNLNASGGPTITSDPGVMLTDVTVATFTDTNTVNVAGDFVATVDWGDGTTTTGTISGSSGSFTVKDSHTYAQNGTDTIVVDITEDASDGQGTANAGASTTARIGLAPGTGSDLTTKEGTPIPAGTQIATFTDNNLTDTFSSFTAQIDWGDGTTTTGTVTGAIGSFTVFGGPHTYPAEVEDVVTAIVTRTSDLNTIMISGTATVTEADVLAATGDNVSGSSGTPLNNVQVATFTTTYTANVASDFAANIDWGDGTVTQGTVSGSSGTFTVDGTHTYATGGTDTFTVSVFDADGTASASANGTATIAQRTLTGTMVLNSATEGSALANSTTVATFTDSVTSDTAGDFSATIVWGDGATTAGTVVGSNGSFTVQGGHTYPDEGSDPASVTLTHNPDSASATASGSVAVAEADVLAGQGKAIKASTHRPFSGVVATFSDTFTGNNAGDFTASINWGDGTVTAGTVSGGGASYSVSGTHQYAHPGHDNITVTLSDDSPGTATATANSTANVSSGANNDFNGDTFSDLLFQQNVNSAHPNVQVELLTSNGTTIASSGITANTKGWPVVAAGDFNGDNKADVVLQNTDGTPDIWLMNGSTRTSTVTLANAGSSWHIIAADDFNGDGQADLLFQSDGGQVGIWLMNGTSVVSMTGLANPGSGWSVIGAGDFNGDGNADILFQNHDGTPMIWEMNGTSVIAQATLTNPGSSWKVIGAGDFNNDGNSDILFQQNSGTPGIWIMNGTSVVSMTGLTNPIADWSAIGTSDLNGDGNADIIWQRADGTPGYWDMNGTTVVATGVFPNQGPQWQLEDDGPFDTASNQPTLRTSAPDTASGVGNVVNQASLVNLTQPQVLPGTVSGVGLHLAT
jgi:hypothetical protein